MHDRVRIASALGAVIGGLLLSGDAFNDVPEENWASWSATSSTASSRRLRFPRSRPIEARESASP